MSEPRGTILWRISNYSDLSGRGGLESPGRWHPAGFRIVYLADSPSSALLETLVHLEITQAVFPDFFKLLKVEVPIESTILQIEVPEGDAWKTDFGLTRRLGSEWLRSMAAPMASVPSAIAPETRNILLNPLHTDAAPVRIVSERLERFYPRLFRIGGH